MNRTATLIFLLVQLNFDDLVFWLVQMINKYRHEQPTSPPQHQNRRLATPVSVFSSENRPDGSARKSWGVCRATGFSYDTVWSTVSKGHIVSDRVCFSLWLSSERLWTVSEEKYSRPRKRMACYRFFFSVFWKGQVERHCQINQGEISLFTG